MYLNFYRHIYQTLSNNPDQIFIIWPELNAEKGAVNYSGEAILKRIFTIQHYLQEQQVKANQKILLALPVSFELICSLLASMALGAVPVLPPTKLSGFKGISWLRKQKIKALLSEKPLSPAKKLLLRAMGIKSISIIKAKKSLGEIDFIKTVSKNQTALISHSSGSTGTPKAIHRSHAVLEAQHKALKEAFPAQLYQRDFSLFPNILLHNLAVGTISILPDIPWGNLIQFNPLVIINQILHHQVQTLTGNVFYFQNLLNYLSQHPHDFSRVTGIGIGGSPVPENLAFALKTYFAQAEIFIIYGSSEAEPIAIRKIAGQPTKPEEGYRVGSVVDNLEWKLNRLGEIKFQNGQSFAVGEVTVKGAHVATEKEWLGTGDFGYLNAENELVLTGRKGNEAIHAGTQHYQVEHVLRHLKQVEQVAVKSTAKGFVVYLQGQTPKSDVWAALKQYFPEVPFLKLTYCQQIPVDKRHFSKILYENLN